MWHAFIDVLSEQGRMSWDELFIDGSFASANKVAASNIGQPSSTEQKDLSRGIGVDMSSTAITCRLDIVDELRDLAQELAHAKRLGIVHTTLHPAEDVS